MLGSFLRVEAPEEVASKFGLDSIEGKENIGELARTYSALSN